MCVCVCVCGGGGGGRVGKVLGEKEAGGIFVGDQSKTKTWVLSRGCGGGYGKCWRGFLLRFSSQ